MNLDAGHEEHASRRLALDARKLKEGDLYTVRAEFFGHVTDARFSVVTVPAAPRRKARRKTGKKKAGKKKGGG